MYMPQPQTNLIIYFNIFCFCCLKVTIKKKQNKNKIKNQSWFDSHFWTGLWKCRTILSLATRVSQNSTWRNERHHMMALLYGVIFSSVLFLFLLSCPHLFYLISWNRRSHISVHHFWKPCWIIDMCTSVFNHSFCEPSFDKTSPHRGEATDGPNE